MQALWAERWAFADYFEPPQFSDTPELDPTIQTARAYLKAAAIDQHPFFRVALGNHDAIALWAAQESVITNQFSQTLFSMMALIKNVHLRSVLLPVVAGEHSALKEGRAVGSHPHLLSKLVIDIGLDPESICPISATIRFAEALNTSLSSLPRALGCLGIGNEAMLIPEYTAVEALFSLLYPRELYRPFLHANIEEDHAHSALMDIAAVAAFRSDEDRKEFLLGAREGVDSRVQYYDDLVTLISGWAI
jgi:Iron-containing redox enzyme